MFGEDDLKATDWMAMEQAEQQAEADRMVVLSDVWLDEPNTFDYLHTVFAGARQNGSELQMHACVARLTLM